MVIENITFVVLLRYCMKTTSWFLESGIAVTPFNLRRVCFACKDVKKECQLHLVAVLPLKQKFTRNSVGFKRGLKAYLACNIYHATVKRDHLQH